MTCGSQIIHFYLIAAGPGLEKIPTGQMVVAADTLRSCDLEHLLRQRQGYNRPL